MGRKPKSLKELELSGALKARPARYAKRIADEKASATVEQNANIAPAPAKLTPLGSAPKWLSVDEKAIWKELSKTYPNLSFSDRFHLEIAVKLTHKLRTAEGGLKGQEYSQLLSILDRFAPKDNPAPVRSIKNDSTDSEPVTLIKSDNSSEPLEDTRTPEEIAWDEFVAEGEEMERRDKLTAAECRRREQTTPPDHLTETEKKHWARYHEVRLDLFPDEKAAWDKTCEENRLWREAHPDLTTKPKVEEKVEYNLAPPPRPEPFEMDPARKREQMERKWSM